MFDLSTFPHHIFHWGGCGVMAIVVGNGHGNTSSNPGCGWLHFALHSYPWEKDESNYSPPAMGK